MTPIYDNTKYQQQAMQVKMQAHEIKKLDHIRMLCQITIALLVLALSAYGFTSLLAYAVNVYR